MAPNVKERIESIIKSSRDRRTYRALILENDMKVFLMSDPKTDKSAAAVNVGIGHMSDPDELPGLAHFCEHMLFLGTERYPEENEYHKFLSEHGGSGNATTSADQTNYYFDILPEHLSGALERFSKFFICPLFTESATEREVNAVNSEHEKNIPNEDWRLEQLDRSTAKKSHAYHKFGTGNKETLSTVPKEKGIDVREELLKFHDTWYSSNIMNLCILGKESLDELEEMAVKLFSDVKNKSVTSPSWPEHPFGPDEVKLIGYIVPIKDIRILHITFPIPDLYVHYKTNPGYYLCHLIGHEGPGSLLTALKMKSWCNSLVAASRCPARGFGFLSVHVDLTQEGIDHVNDIIKMLFQYLNMLKVNGPQEWFFNEIRDIRGMNFRFRDITTPRYYVSCTAINMQRYPLKEVLSGSFLIDDWKPELIDMLMSYLTPENVRVAVVAKKYEPETNETEKWYGIKYKLEKISPIIVNDWTEAGTYDCLQLPRKNDFIPSDFELKDKEDNAPEHPVLVKDTPLTRAWFKQDDEYNLPKTALRFELASPLAYMDPLTCTMTYLFVELFVDGFNEYTYAAELAGMAWTLLATKYGIMLTISGYNHKQPVLLGMILDQMTKFKVDPTRYEILKEKYVRELQNLEAEQPYQHAMKFLTIVLAQAAWTKDDLLAGVKDLTLKSLEAFVPQLLSKLHIECFIHGNIDRKAALELVNMVEDKLNSFLHICPLLPYQMLRNREYKLEDGCNYLLEVYNTVHRSSCVDVYYQCGLQCTQSNMHLKLLVKLLNEPCFYNLRTVEQLGYIVSCDVRGYGGVHGLRIIVQSNKHPKYVDQRIEVFIENMKNYLEELPKEAFNRIKESLASQLLERPKVMEHLTAWYWGEISTHQYHFDRTKVEVAYLKTVEKDNILQFYNEFIHPSSSRRHKVAVHVISVAEGGAGKRVETEDGISPVTAHLKEPKLIENITEFKSDHGLFPLVKPYINIYKPTQSKL
ncbi:insulin-degrading enzyme [Anabrus simplex]|uniref:insulin-degrading enzyme n=1 Tax=Anabrus simplex TaxID=316456 RepID=UPI0035A3454A